MPLPMGAVVLSALLYLGALAFPGFYVVQGTEDPKPWIEGFWLLVFGPFALLQGIVAWIANPLLVAAWIALWKRKRGLGLFFALAGMVFALTFFLNHRFHDGSQMNSIVHAAIGYWLWLASLGVVAIGAVLPQDLLS
jgi:hypothetical protein